MKRNISSLRIFSFQTKDPAFILYPDLYSSFLISLLVNKKVLQLNNIGVTYIYPTRNMVKKFFEEVFNFDEEYFLFNLENYYHSSNYSLGFIKLVLEKFKENNFRKKIIIHSLKISPEAAYSLMKEYNFIACIVMTDIEYFFNNFFVKGKSIKKIKNIIYRDGNDILYTGKENVDYDLNEYLLPAYYDEYYVHYLKNKDEIIDIIDDRKDYDEKIYYKWPKKKVIEFFRYLPGDEVMLITGRGCKYKCAYCYRGVKYSNVRQLSLDILKKDLDKLSEFKYKYVYFYDDCFVTTNLDRLDKIIDLLSKYHFLYGIACRYEVLTSYVVRLLSKINIARIQIGLQSINSNVNLSMRRGFNPREFKKVVLFLKKKGIEISLDIILGLPGDGLKGFIDTFNFALSVKPKSIFINTLFLNPGTELYINKEKYGIKLDGSLNDLFYVPVVKSSLNFNKKEIDLAKKYVKIVMDKVKDINIVLR